MTKRCQCCRKLVGKLGQKMQAIPVLDVQLNPLDILLAGVGYRLGQLAKGDDERFLALVRNKKAILQFVSDDGVVRVFEFDDGVFSQRQGKAENADLTIGFANGAEGAKLLIKADTVALMQAVQDDKMKISGDYKLVLWFVSLAKFVGKVPEEYAPYVEKLTPVWQSAKPYAYKASQFATKTWGKIKHKMK